MPLTEILMWMFLVWGSIMTGWNIILRNKNIYTNHRLTFASMMVDILRDQVDANRKEKEYEN